MTMASDGGVVTIVQLIIISTLLKPAMNAYDLQIQKLFKEIKKLKYLQKYPNSQKMSFLKSTMALLYGTYYLGLTSHDRPLKKVKTI